MHPDPLPSSLPLQATTSPVLTLWCLQATICPQHRTIFPSSVLCPGRSSGNPQAPPPSDDPLAQDAGSHGQAQRAQPAAGRSPAGLLAPWAFASLARAPPNETWGDQAPSSHTRARLPRGELTPRPPPPGTATRPSCSATGSGTSTRPSSSGGSTPTAAPGPCTATAARRSGWPLGG